MSNIPTTAYVVAFEKLGDRTLRMTHRQYRLHVRWRFIESLRRVQYFRVVLDRELRPLWRQMGEIARDIYAFDALPRTSPYVVEVHRLVSERMNCLVDNDPADWVMQAIHVSVMRRPELTIEDLEAVGYVRRDLSIGVNTIGMAEVLQIQHTQDGDEQEEGRRLFDQPYAAFDDWEELRRIAHAELDELVDEIEKHYTAATSHYLDIRPSKLQRLSENNMKGLIAWIWPELGARSTLKRDTRRRLLDDLGLDHVSRAITPKE